MTSTAITSMFSAELVVPAIGDAFRKLDPRQLVRNPVMFTTAVVALLLTVLLVIGGERPGRRLPGSSWSSGCG